MMHSFDQSVFHQVILPPLNRKTKETQNIQLQRNYRFQIHPKKPFNELDLVIFDFETTGLNTKSDRIIEIGAIRKTPDGTVTEFSTLIHPGQKLPLIITKICGITDEMLKGKPPINEVMDDFLEFIDGGVLVAHNADFDYNFLKQSCLRLGKSIDFPSFCTLKLARKFLADLESRSLDALAQHYDLTFTARHRSIGDCQVTLSVLDKMIEAQKEHFQTWDQLIPFEARTHGS